MNDVALLLRMFLDDARLKVLAQISGEPLPLHAIAANAGLSETETLRALYPLKQAGLLDERFAADGVRYSFRRQPLIDALRELRTQALPDLPEDASDFDRKILGDFLVGGKLKAIPVQWKKKDVILRYLAERFEPDRDYPEPEVNAVLNRFHADHATLRRALVDTRLMARENGIYRRTRAGRLI